MMNIRPAALACIAALLLGLSGCGDAAPWSRPGLDQPVAEPPLIPAPPPEGPARPSDAAETTNEQPYQDVLGLPEGERPRLKAALTQVMQARILPIPTGEAAKVAFEPDKPITYGEFARWFAAFQNHRNLENVPQASTGKPAAPQALLKETLTLHEGVVLQADQPVTRQQWAALYALLSSRKLPTEAQAETLAPSGADAGQVFAQFKDAANISPWARPAVALAYKEGVIAEVLGLSPEQLTVDTGFQPSRSLTRGEALVFLSHFHQSLSP